MKMNLVHRELLPVVHPREEDGRVPLGVPSGEGAQQGAEGPLELNF